MIGRLIAVTALATGVWAAPASAAVTLQPLKPCYVSAAVEEEQREGIAIRGSGFTPMAAVDIYVDGVLALTGQANVVGDVTATAKAPYQPNGQRTFTLTVAERANPANVVTVQPLVSALTVVLRPREANSSSRVRFRGRGFTATNPADRKLPVFAHYLFYNRARDTRRHVKTVRLGRPQSACGTFSVRRRQIPIRRPRTGPWLLQVDQQRAYSPSPPAKAEVEICVREVFREPTRPRQPPPAPQWPECA
jgi:hypothetical protein